MGNDTYQPLYSIFAPPLDVQDSDYVVRESTPPPLHCLQYFCTVGRSKPPPPHYSLLRVGRRLVNVTVGGIGGIDGHSYGVPGIWPTTVDSDAIQIPEAPHNSIGKLLARSHIQPPEGAEELVNTVEDLGVGGHR